MGGKSKASTSTSLQPESLKKYRLCGFILVPLSLECRGCHLCVSSHGLSLSRHCLLFLPTTTSCHSTCPLEKAHFKYFIVLAQFKLSSSNTSYFRLIRLSPMNLGYNPTHNAMQIFLPTYSCFQILAHHNRHWAALRPRLLAALIISVTISVSSHITETWLHFSLRISKYVQAFKYLEYGPSLLQVVLWTHSLQDA